MHAYSLTIVEKTLPDLSLFTLIVLNPFMVSLFEIFVSIWHPLQTVQVAVTLPAEKLCPHPAHGAVPEQPPNPILRLPEPIVAMMTV